MLAPFSKKLKIWHCKQLTKRSKSPKIWRKMNRYLFHIGFHEILVRSCNWIRWLGLNRSRSSYRDYLHNHRYVYMKIRLWGEIMNSWFDAAHSKTNHSNTIFRRTVNAHSVKSYITLRSSTITTTWRQDSHSYSKQEHRGSQRICSLRYLFRRQFLASLPSNARGRKGKSSLHELSNNAIVLPLQDIYTNANVLDLVTYRGMFLFLMLLA